MKHITKEKSGYALEQYSNELLCIGDMKGKEFRDYYNFMQERYNFALLSKGNIIIEPFAYYLKGR